MIFKWLFPPKTGNGSEDFAYQALHYTLILLLLIALVMLIIGDSIIHRVATPVFSGIVIICYTFLQRERLQIASTIFLTLFWLMITGIVYSLNGINNSSFYLYVIVIIFTNIFYTSRRAVIFVTVLSCISGIILYSGQNVGFFPLQSSVSPYIFDRLIIGIAIFGSSGILLSSAAHTLRNSLEQVQYSKQQLQARNQELEALTERLRISEERYRILFENSGVIAAVYDEKDTIVLANEPAATSVERTPETMVGMSIADIFGDTADMVSQKHREALEKNDMVLFEGSIELPAGGQMEYLRHVIPLPQSSDAEDEQQILVLTTDITERKQSEQRERELELAQEKLTFFTDFFGTVSHDIKTPLSTINTSLYLLEKNTDNPDHHMRIDRIKAQVALIQAYILDMLMISRLEHIPTFHPVNLNVGRLIEDIIEKHAPLIEQKSMQCTLDTPDEALIIQGEHDQLQRAFTNLIENAINYTPESGTVTVSITEQAEMMQVVISDTGIGIRGDDLPYIFEQFYRSADAKSRISSGTGLGLAIVKRIIKLHKGDITVSSEEGKGSTFTITLPIRSPGSSPPL